MLNTVSALVENQGAPTGRVPHLELLEGLRIAHGAREILLTNMGIYRLDATEREVVVRILLGEGTKEICYHQGITRDRYYNVIEKIGRKLNGGSDTSYGDRTKIVLTLLGIGPVQ